MASIRKYSDMMLILKKGWLDECTRANALLSTLPQEIQDLPGEGCDINGNILHLSFTGMDAAKALKILGVTDLKTMYGWSGNWRMTGGHLLMSDGSVATVVVEQVPMPEDCHIEEYTETVNRTRAICNKTGEAI